MKKFTLLVLACLLQVSCSRMALAADPYFLTYHMSYSFFINGQVTYDTSYHRQMEFIAGFDRPQTEQDKSDIGSLAISGGTYYYFDESGQQVNVNGETRTFPLVYNSGDDTYVEYTLKLGNRYIFPRGGDGSLQNKRLDWLFFGENYVTTIPNFRTTAKQLENYVPYAEHDSSKRAYSMKMVHPSNTGKALSIPFSGRYRIRFRSADGSQIAQSDWQYYEAGETPAVEYTLPNGVEPSNVHNILLDAHIDEDGRFRYIWRFFMADESNAGVADTSPLNETVSIDIGGEHEFKISFKSGYDSYDTTKPFLVADKSVLSVTSWTYDYATHEGTAILRGLKDGETTVRVLYEKINSDSTYDELYTTAVKVIVGNDGNSSNGDSSSGGSSGCDAGFAGMLILASLSCTVISSKPRKQ